MDETELKSKLPQPVAQRLQSLRLTDASATLVLDAAGLGRAEASALEDLARQAVIDAGGPHEVRVALMANKVHRRIIAVASGKHTKSEELGFGGAEFVPWQIGAVM